MDRSPIVNIDAEPTENKTSMDEVVADPEFPATGATDPVVGPSKPRLLGILGPGLITGASDDDPSGIATYSQAGAQLGFNSLWLMLFSYPLMAATQEISARIGRTTGRGLRWQPPAPLSPMGRNILHRALAGSKRHQSRCRSRRHGRCSGHGNRWQHHSICRRFRDHLHGPGRCLFSTAVMSLFSSGRHWFCSPILAPC